MLGVEAYIERYGTVKAHFSLIHVYSPLDPTQATGWRLHVHLHSQKIGHGAVVAAHSHCAGRSLLRPLVEEGGGIRLEQQNIGG